jgi:general secretion pathway protein I
MRKLGWAKGERGSALVEALVGIAIVSVTLAGMYRAVADSAARNHMAQDKRTASLVAQSELASVGSLVPLAPGTTTGISAGYRWEIDVQPLTLKMPKSDAGGLWDVMVAVRSTKGTLLTSLHTAAVGGNTGSGG